MTLPVAVLYADSEKAFQRVCGMTILERQLWTIARAGFAAARVVGTGADSSRGLHLPPGLDIIWTDSVLGTERSVLISGTHLIRPKALRTLARKAEGAVVWEDDHGRTVVETGTGGPRKHLGAKETIAVADGTGRKEVEEWLLEEGVKPGDGFMARHFDRRLSLAVSRMLMDSPVSPNMMTIVSALIGLAGAACFLKPVYSFRLAGALVVWLHSVLDGCDGELARVRFQESRFGQALDFWGDNLVHVALFGAMAAGFARADKSLVPVIAGALAILGTVGSAVLVYRRKRSSDLTEASAEGSEDGVLARLERFLEARDFIYLMVALAAIDRLYEFMWACGVGSTLFFFMTVYLYVGGSSYVTARQPYPAR